MSDTTTKSIAIKFVGTSRQAETLTIEPGTTVQDVLRSVGLGSGGFTLTNPSNPEQVLRGRDQIYALANDGDMFAASSDVIAGLEAVA